MILLVFISLILVGLGLLFFFSRLRDGDFEHGDRLSILPLTDDSREMIFVAEKRTEIRS